MLEGVKALFKFTMAILYLAFQITPPSSCEIYTTIRNTARDLYDVRLLLSIVNQIKLPKDSYFAIRRSFYMVQSSFNSDQFYMQTLSSETSRLVKPNKPFSCQQLPETKAPALSLLSGASLLSSATESANSKQRMNASGCDARKTNKSLGSISSLNKFGQGASGNKFTITNSVCQDNGVKRPRIRTSENRSKICIQSMGKLGRSHLRIIDANSRSNERSLMSPLRNCLLIGISNCGKQLVFARQSSKRCFKSFKEQDLTFHVHEISTEIFDGFYLEELEQVIIISRQGEIFKIGKISQKCDVEASKQTQLNSSNTNLDDCTETLILSCLIEGHEKVKLRLSTMDSLTNLLWIYVECEDLISCPTQASGSPATTTSPKPVTLASSFSAKTESKRGLPSEINCTDRSFASVKPKTEVRFKNNNPFMSVDRELCDDNQSERATNTSLNSKDSCNQKQVQLNRKVTKREHRFNHQRHNSGRVNYTRKIIVVDTITFDLFSAFAVHPNFGEIINLRASLVAFCQLSNPMSNQFSSRIVQIGPTGRYEQLLSFSDVADYMVSVPESFKIRYSISNGNKTALTADVEANLQQQQQQQRYSSLKRLLTHSMSFTSMSFTSMSSGSSETSGRHSDHDEEQTSVSTQNSNSGALTKYYQSLLRSYSTNRMPDQERHQTSEINKFPGSTRLEFVGTKKGL